jgi:dUTP pyrophosphatase
MNEENNIQRIDCKIEFVKTHDDAKLPEKAHHDDNCYDLFAVEDTTIPRSKVDTTGGVDVGHAVVPTGITVGNITPGFGFVIKPKSGLGFKHGIQPHFGEIDTGYRSDLGVKIYNLTGIPYHYKKGDKVAQIKIEKNYVTTVEWADQITPAERGAHGFGSSGR